METIVNGVKNLVSFLNPLDWIPNLVKNIAEFFVGDGENSKGVFGFLKDIISNVGSIFSWLGKFFDNLLDFVIHIVVPTDSQWQEIKDSYSNLGTSIVNHIPLWSFIKNTITDVQNEVFQPEDFLIIKMPSFNFFGVQTGEIECINVLQAYEPYRVQIRSLLALVVYACGFVYIVKEVTNYGVTQHANMVIANVNSIQAEKEEQAKKAGGKK